jgi:hypothetical protein
MYRMHPEKEKLKKYFYRLVGKELYTYRSKEDEKHKGMLNLAGAFVKEEKEQMMTKENILVFPISLIFPNKIRTFYLISKVSSNFN